MEPIPGSENDAPRDPAREAGERSALYARLADAFRYPDAARAGDAATLELPPQAPEAGAIFLAAFDPAVSPEACSLHEAAYVTRDLHALFEELIRFYGFFGLTREESAELPDHVTVELEFMHFLTFLEHSRAEEGNRVEGLQRAQRDFLKRHLAVLAQGIRGRLRSEDPHLQELARLLDEFVQTEVAALDAAEPVVSARGVEPRT